MGVSIACLTDGVVGIYGVATVPECRRRGYSGALPGAAMQTAPAVPAVLEPSDIAVPPYQSMGFTEIGRFRHWRHTARGI